MNRFVWFYLMVIRCIHKKKKKGKCLTENSSNETLLRKSPYFSIHWLITNFQGSISKTQIHRRIHFSTLLKLYWYQNEMLHLCLYSRDTDWGGRDEGDKPRYLGLVLERQRKGKWKPAGRPSGSTRAGPSHLQLASSNSGSGTLCANQTVSAGKCFLFPGPLEPHTLPWTLCFL